MGHDLKEITTGVQTIYEGRIFNVKKNDVRLPNGETADREIVEHSGGVCVLPLTANNTVLMVRQYRIPNDEITLEIPAGKKNYGEDAFECGMRELEEETGMRAHSVYYLGHCHPTPAYCTENIEMYLATDLYPGKKQLDEDEFLDNLEMSLNDLVRMVMDDEITDAKTQIAVLKANEWLKNVEAGEEKWKLKKVR